ncbi:MAG: S1/P1 nuclease [Lentisphaerae bacterium]|nr:S1/P1 nuclease [Lentisphaerota bacterium]MCP4102288.1 S1/P1 nuclease [Lentisphaerota bacterium]
MKGFLSAGSKFILVITLSAFLMPLTGMAWWNTGHSLAALLAEKRLSEKTLKNVNELLSKQIKLPGQVKCYSTNAHYMAATASWMDEIKKGWWTSGSSKSFYSTAHYIDIPVDITNPPVPSDVRSLLETEITVTGGDNVLTTLRSAVKSLAGDTTQGEKAFALRLLIHNVGDITCPMHACDVQNGTSVPTTRGGNWVYINTPIQVKSVDGNSQKVSKLHAFWDSMANANEQVPYADSCDLTSQDEEFLGKMVNVLNNKFSGALDRNIANTPDIMDWAEDTAIVALTFTADPEIYKNSYVSNSRIYVDELSSDYQEKAKDAAQSQVFKAGARLANLINAVYDPENAPAAYVDYVESLLKDKSVKYLFELKKVDVQFY